MELKYKWVLWIGAGVIVLMCVGLFIINRRMKAEYSGGKKIAGPMYSRDDSYFKRRVWIYKTCLAGIMAGSALALLLTFIMMSKPYSKERVQDEKYSRDIMLCIDISTSVDYLNENLLERLKDTVDELKGERFGIVLFNTSPVLLAPLTDDYEYIKEQLDLIAKCLKVRNNADVSDLFSGGASEMYEWLYYDNYITSGTLVGNEQRGSSLIGDGLAAATGDFSDKDKERTKVIIFSTDNDIQGTPIATLDEAASICRNSGVTVYGIGTKEMSAKNKANMKSAVESTGGQFFLEEESGSFDQIVSSIEKISKSLVKSKPIVREIPRVGIPFIAAFAVLVLVIGLGRVIKL